MDFFASLLRAYESAEKVGLVDNQDQVGTTLLPIYHSSSKSHGNDVIVVNLSKEGDFIKADFLGSEETIIFPVTADSMARSGKDPAPHPLVDKLSYYVAEMSQSQYDTYHKQLDTWVEACQDEHVRSYLSLIQNFLLRVDFLPLVLQSLFGKEYRRDGLKITIPQVDGKEKTVDLSSCFVEFKVDSFIGQGAVSVTNYKTLHENYINFVEALDGNRIICNISGQEETLATKHRGLQGNAKIISVSNNPEMFKGRFLDRDDVFTVGTKTSEKIHLMVKFLLEHDQTHKFLGGAQNLINWFSDDLTNESQLDITVAQTVEWDEWSTMSLIADTKKDSSGFEIGKTNQNIGQSFIKGVRQFSDASNYYLAILNKTSNGRISLKYFREMTTSQLLKNLDRWQEWYSWEATKKGGGTYLKTPSFDEMIKAAYGVDRGFLEIDNDSFKSAQYQALITALLDGQEVPRALVKKLESNLKERHRYPKQWYQLQQVSLAVLHKQNGREFTPMLDHENKDRSYLFGRLLAIYELLESRRYFIDGGSQERITNAERYWTAFTGQPAKMMGLLENKIRPYRDILKIKRPGLLRKLEIEKEEIMALLTPQFMDKDFGQALEYKFIFGYYAQKRVFESKQEKESEE
ncbi:type I-C CRISPR-associated protein Cas8c/Csd1 [Streptococcus iniae]|nr:type I-C CRISPR-associated protein Cas8c/Csd1 [Streptococcus iniae]